MTSWPRTVEAAQERRAGFLRPGCPAQRLDDVAFEEKRLALSALQVKGTVGSDGRKLSGLDPSGSR